MFEPLLRSDVFIKRIIKSKHKRKVRPIERSRSWNEGGYTTRA